MIQNIKLKELGKCGYEETHNKRAHSKMEKYGDNMTKNEENVDIK